ncbi:acyltransferase [uncultured Microbacterium sp.]|uniref:Acetyltransferase n=1 Tax=uncultured Microbacterium sp. TaxID=191216 RepID=A0A1Y5P1M3_9MICO|nr:acyltransferase [uncultured Microbacterium sp.]SBS71229.1 Acetyltransferase [uncultured Microbacterium sp.]
MTRFSGIERRAALMADAGALVRAGRMLTRGLVHKPFFGASQGPLFIGRGVRLSGLAHIRHAGRLVIEDDAELQGLSAQGVLFGSDVSIGSRTAIRPSSYYGGEVGVGLTVGDRSSFNASCFIGCSGRVTIGSDVMFGPGVQVFSENHVHADARRPIKEQGVERSFVVVEDDCWIGANSIITAGVTIGRGSIVGAGSVVTRDIPPGSVAVGAPARVIGQR